MSTSTGTELEVVRRTVLEHTTYYDHTTGRPITDRINLAGRISSEIVKRDMSIEDALTCLETLGTVKSANLTAVMRLADTGLPLLNVHHLFAFCDELAVPVDFGRDWLRFFAVELADEDEITNAIIMAEGLIQKLRDTERDPIQQKINHDRDNTSFLSEVRLLAEQRQILVLETLCDELMI